jgi:hypothetical protein
VTVQITAAERDALYEQIYVRLSGIDAVWLAVEGADYEAADRLAREYTDDLQLVLDGLGWGAGSGEPLELATPPEVLRRVLTRMQAAAERQRSLEDEERATGHVREERTQRLMEACRRVLTELAGKESLQGR